MKRKLLKRISFISLSLSLLGSSLLLQGGVAQASTTKTLLKQPGIQSSINKLLAEKSAKSAPQKAFVSSKINTTSSDEVRVIVQLQNQPVSVGKYAAKMGINTFATESTELAIKKEQSAFVSAASKQGISLKKNYEYSTVFNGMEISIPANQIPLLAQMPGVKSIHENHTYYEMPVSNVQPLDADSPNFEALPLQQIGADYAWAQGLTGKGLKIGVIDTGVDYLHPDLIGAFKGGYDSYFKTNDPYEEPPVAGTSFEGTSHGSHVAGTIVGRAANTTSDIVQKGIAYEADLYAYKVLGFNEETGKSQGTTAQVLDGIEHAVNAGMDVINLSLGSDSEKDPNSPESIALNNAVLSGIVVVVASGNAGATGPYYYSMGSPASSLLAISVGAVTSPAFHFSVQATSSLETVTPVVVPPPSEPTSSPELAPSIEPTSSPDVTTPPAEPTSSPDVTTPPTEPDNISEVTALSAEPTSSPDVTAPSSEPTSPPDVTAAPTEPTSSPVVTETPVALIAAPASVVTTSSPYQFNVMAWTTGNSDFASIIGSDPVDAVFLGLGEESDYTGVDVTNKIAFVSRGDIAFVDKIKNAKKHNAKAIIIFNGNAKPGTKIADLSESIPGRDSNVGSVGYVGDTFDYIPTFDMSGTEGRKLAKQVVDNPGSALKFTFDTNYNNTTVPGDSMADFSSRGPESDDKLSIKPDFSAPGVNILSTRPAYGKYDHTASYDQAYTRESGTSMATPHVAGLTLLLKQAHPEWSPFDIRAALGNTSDIISNESGIQYDVYSQGAGRVNVKNALLTPAILQSVEELTILDKDLNPQEVTNYGNNTSFGVMDAGDVRTNILQLKNTSANTVQYTASVRMHPNVTSDPNDPIDTPDVNNIKTALTNVGPANKISVNGNSTEAFSLTVEPTAAAVDGVYEGDVVLESDGLPSLHLPFVVHVGSELPNNGFGLQELNLSNNSIIIDGNNTISPIDLDFKLTAGNVNYLMFQLENYDGTIEGIFGEYFNEDFSMLNPNHYQFSGFDNKYFDFSGNEKILPEGQYLIAVVALQYDPETEDFVNYPNGTRIEYSIITYFAVKTLDSIELKKVTNAKDNFVANITNTTVLNSSVLTFPTTEEITYQVTASNNTNYIGNDGMLKALPTSGSANVDLTVTIASAAKPTIKTNTVVNVVLNATPVDVDLIELQKVTDAKNHFVPNITNTTVLNSPVLTFPTTDGITYQVTASTNTTYIGNDGILKSLPTSGSANVDLTVTIASKLKPTINTTANVTVTLTAPTSGGSSGGGGGSSSGSSGSVTTPPSSNPSSTAIVNQGQLTVIIKAKVSKTGQTSTATITDADLKAALSKNGNSPVAIVINVPVTIPQQAEVILTPTQLKMLADSNAGNTILVSIGNASVAIPVSIFKNLPANASVSITLGGVAIENTTISNLLPGTTVLSTPFHFEVNVINGSESKPIEVSNRDFIKRSFTIARTVDSSATGALFVEAGKVNGVPATFTRNNDGTTTVVINRPGFSIYAAASRQIKFNDIASSFAQSRIQTLANKFLISGTSADTFSPTQDVTRAEFAAMLTRALGLQAKSAAPFTDVKATDWFANNVAAAYEAGLISGVGNDKFDPNATISRQDLAVMLSRALTLLKVQSKSLPGHEAYADASKFSSYAQSSIQIITENGIMDGEKVDNSSFFKPVDPTSREVAASAVYFLLQKAKLIN